MKKIVTSFLAFVLVLVAGSSVSAANMGDLIQSEVSLLQTSTAVAMNSSDLTRTDQHKLLDWIERITEGYNIILQDANVENPGLETNVNRLLDLVYNYDYNTGNSENINEILNLFSNVTNMFFNNALFLDSNGEIDGYLESLVRDIQEFASEFENFTATAPREITNYANAVKQLRQVSGSLEEMQMQIDPTALLQWVKQMIDEIDTGLDEVNSNDPADVAMQDWVDVTRSLIAQLEQDLLAGEDQTKSTNQNIITSTLRTIPNVITGAIRNIIDSLISTMTNAVFSTINSVMGSVFQGVNSSINQVINGILTSVESAILSFIPKSGYEYEKGIGQSNSPDCVKPCCDSEGNCDCNRCNMNGEMPRNSNAPGYIVPVCDNEFNCHFEVRKGRGSDKD